MKIENKDKPINPLIDSNGRVITSGSMRLIEEDCLIGLTKREHIAAMALQGILSCHGTNIDSDDAAEESIAYANELLKQLDK